MAKHTGIDIKKIIKEAAEIAGQVPTILQEAAFNKVVDLLSGSNILDPVKHTNIDDKQSKVIEKKLQNVVQISDPDIEDLVASIDSTKHPQIKTTNKILNNSLMLLQIALKEYGVDNLTPAEISKILTDKFRIATTNKAVEVTLSRWLVNLVNRTPKDQGFTYSIMAAGDEYLDSLKDKASQPQMSIIKKRANKKKRDKNNIAVETPEKDQAKNKSIQSKVSKKLSPTSSIGPKNAILSLIEDGYLNTARTSQEIQSYLKKNEGLNYDTDSLRMTMLRLVRKKLLARNDNNEGNYVYRTRKS